MPHHAELISPYHAGTNTSDMAICVEECMCLRRWRAEEWRWHTTTIRGTDNAYSTLAFRNNTMPVMQCTLRVCGAHVADGGRCEMSTRGTNWRAAGCRTKLDISCCTCCKSFSRAGTTDTCMTFRSGDSRPVCTCALLPKRVAHRSMPLQNDSCSHMQQATPALRHQPLLLIFSTFGLRAAPPRLFRSRGGVMNICWRPLAGPRHHP